MNSSMFINTIRILLITFLFGVFSCSTITKNDDENKSEYLYVSGVISTELKYIEYERDFGEIELKASNRSIYSIKYPYYNYKLYYDPNDDFIHQQFSKISESGLEHYCPLSIDFDYNEVDQTFSNIYAEFCLLDTSTQSIDSSSVFIIEGLTSK